MSYGNYPDHSKIKRILIIMFRHLGDVLLTTPALKVLKDKFPDSIIDVYVYENTREMLEGHPSISEIITYDRKIKKFNLIKKLVHELKRLNLIRKKKYDLVFNLTEGDRGAIVAKASRAKYVVGYDNGHGMKGKGKVYTHKVKQCHSPRHAVEMNLDFVRRIGIFPEEKDKSLFYHVPDSSYESVKNLLDNNDIDRNNFILIHPASRWRFKCWPTWRLEELSKRLIENGEKLVFTAGTEDFEREMIEEVIKDLPKENILNLASKVSLKELGALIEMSKILLCVDSVPLHMASALKAKCVCLFGPTSEKKWGPWQNNDIKIIAADYICRPCCLDGCGGSKVSDCLQNITEDRVFGAIEELMNQN